jgi:mRNA interferase RelE/StbE
MPDYAVNFRRSAEQDLRRLDVIVQRRVLRAIAGLAHEPRPPGCRKLMGKAVIDQENGS